MGGIRATLLLLPLVACVQARNYMDVLESEWNNYQDEYGKVYESEEEWLLRKQIFIDNKRQIDRHNVGYLAGLESYAMGVNQFTDMLDKEFIDLYLSGLNQSGASSNSYIYVTPMSDELPDSVDWVKEGAVTAVKDQGKCGSCWAFSAVGLIEGAHFLNSGQLVPLSVQNLIDCSSHAPYNNDGCRGGDPGRALAYVRDNGGIDIASFYPYAAEDQACQFNPGHIGAKVNIVLQVLPHSEIQLAIILAGYGPISVSIHVSNKFKLYKSGVFLDADCYGKLDHSMLLVGYGTDPVEGDFWLVKNSWGTSWGEKGYIRIARNKHNQCEIASEALISF